MSDELNALKMRAQQMTQKIEGDSTAWSKKAATLDDVATMIMVGQVVVPLLKLAEDLGQLDLSRENDPLVKWVQILERALDDLADLHVEERADGTSIETVVKSALDDARKALDLDGFERPEVE